MSRGPITYVCNSEQKKHEKQKLVMMSVEPEEVLADHVELNVKGVFMPRGDLYRMMSSIVGKTVYGSKTFQVPVRGDAVRFRLEEKLCLLTQEERELSCSQ